MSGDPRQDYFSDGLSEELLNSLVSIRDLQVAARTSSFFFKGKDVDLADVAHKLNVGAVLEGSVRKDGGRVRITAQLINAVTGFHLWSQTYDRDLRNVLALQTEIATAVTRALQATLLADAAAAIEVGGTQDPAAFDAYLRGRSLERKGIDKDALLGEMAAFLEAIRIDPKFAKAYAAAANAHNSYANNFARETEVRAYFKRARELAERAIAVAPDLGEGHAAMAFLLERGYLDFSGASEEYKRALALAPNNADVLMRAGSYLTAVGPTDAGLEYIRRVIALDQLNANAYSRLDIALYSSRRYREAIEAADRSLQIRPDYASSLADRGLALLALGQIESARAPCQKAGAFWAGRLCMALLYEKLHQHTESAAQMAAMQADLGNSAAYQYAEIAAQWGDKAQALDWLEAAYRLPDPGIIGLRLDPLIDPLRGEPRFKEIERKLKFPG
jgi:TolB-like protein/Tfp pilus assembly protein PilF